MTRPPFGRYDSDPVNLRQQVALPRLLMLLVGLSAACDARRDSRAQLVERAGSAMGSDLGVAAWPSADQAAQSTFTRVFELFDRLDALMSVWRPGSDVLRINEAAGVRAVAVSAEVREALLAARQISEWTGGKFDVTFGALADVWKFDHDQDDTVPEPSAIRARLPLVDYRQVEIDEGAGTVFLKRTGMRLHLGGIGKGYAVE